MYDGMEANKAGVCRHLNRREFAKLTLGAAAGTFCATCGAARGASAMAGSSGGAEPSGRLGRTVRVRLQPVSLVRTTRIGTTRARELIKEVEGIAGRQDFVDVLAPIAIRRVKDLEKLQHEGITAFVLLTQPRDALVERLARLGKPVLPSWDEKGNPRIGPEICQQVKTAGGVCLYPQGEVEVTSALRALRAVALLSGMRVLMVGPLKWFRTEFLRAGKIGTTFAQWTPTELEDLSRIFGMRMLPEEPINAYFAAIEAADEGEAKEWAAKWASEMDIVKGKERLGENLVNYAKIHVAVRNLIKEHNAHALCVSCDCRPTDRTTVLGIDISAQTPEGNTYLNDFVPCWSAAQLIDEGIPWFCKGDTTQLMAISLAMGVSGRAALMGDVYRFSPQEEIEKLVRENIVLQRHDIAPPSMRAKGKRVQLTDMHNRGVGCCDFVEMAQGSTVTLLNVGRGKLEWRCYTGRVVWSKRGNVGPQGPVDNCCMEVAVRVKDAARVWEGLDGWVEHQVLVQGDWMRELEMLGQIYEAKVRNLDA